MSSLQSPIRMETAPALGPVSCESEAYDIPLRGHLNQYEILQTLGRGTHGKVELARNMKTSNLVAIKSVKRKNKDLDRHAKLAQNARMREPEKLSVANKRQANEIKIRREIAILRRLKHPNVVALIEVLDDPTKKRVHIVMEYLGGGELQWRTKNRHPVQTVSQSTRIIRDVMLGLRYLHIQGIVHRDIKPANLLWSEDHITVKISDFGVSVYEIPTNRGLATSDTELEELMMEDAFLNRTAGTPVFLAPEVCPPGDGAHTIQSSKFALDTWALGVTYYCLLFGHPPWECNDYWPLLNRIASTDFEIPETMGSDGLKTGGRRPSNEFIDGKGVLTILDGLLTKDPNNRLTLVELKKIPYLTKDIEDIPRWMQETAKQAGDVILVSEAETQSAIGFVRWRLQSGLEKLRLRSTKLKPAVTNPVSVPLPERRSPMSGTLCKGLSIRSVRDKDSQMASRETSSAEQSHDPNQLGNFRHSANRLNIGIHRKVLDVLTWSKNSAKGHPSRTSSSVDFPIALANKSSDTHQRQRKCSRLSRERPSDFTLQSAGPSRSDRSVVVIGRRNVVSEGESVGNEMKLDSDASGYSNSSEDYGEPPDDRQERLFVGAGGVISSQSGLLHSEWPSSAHEGQDIDDESKSHEIDQEHAERSGVYSGSESSDSRPVEVRRRRPTNPSIRDAVIAAV